MSVEWRLDNTHCIEYTKENFYEEMQKTGMVIKEQEIMWGEIYAVVEAKKEKLNDTNNTVSTNFRTQLK